MKEPFRIELNFRDLGGYEARDGRHIKHGLLYRCGSLNFFTPEEIEELKEYHIHTVLDLRSERECLKYPDPEMEGVIFIQNSGVISQKDGQINFSPEGMKKTGEKGRDQLEKIKGYYEDIPYKNRAFQRMFDEIRAENVPFLFHCASGKDRTGVAAILLLLALDIPEETIREDYLLSNYYKQEDIKQELEGINQEEEPELYELILMLYGVSETVFNIVLNDIHRKYDTTEEYLEDNYGLTQEVLKELRDLYLE